MPARFFRFGILWCVAVVGCLLMPVTALKSFGQEAAEAKPGDGNADADDSGLPPGLIQPRNIPPEMELTKELFSDGEEKEFRQKHENKGFADALKSEKLTDDNKKMLDIGARYWVYRMTMEKYRAEEAVAPKPVAGAPVPKAVPFAQRKENLTDVRKRLLDMIRNANSGRLNAEVRDYFQKSLIAHVVGDKARLGATAESLLENNYHVRLNTVILIGQLSSTNGNPQKTPPEEPAAYAPGYSTLLAVMKDDKQHPSVRIAAVVGLTRICRTGFVDPNDKRRPEIAVAVAAQLLKNDTHWWFQMRLAECLGASGLVGDPAAKGTTVVLNALVTVLSDSKRHFGARTEAARAIGRLNLDPNHPIGPIVAEMVNLGHQMAQAYNANTKRDSWSNHFFGLYLAFKPETSKTMAPGGKRLAGLLYAFPNSREVKEAYDQVVLLTSHVVKTDGVQFTAAQLDAMRDWLKTRLPAKSPTAPQITNPEGGASAASKPGTAG